METSSARLSSVAGKPATLFVALELSKSAWLVAIHSPAADKISQHRLAGGDAMALLSLIARKRGEPRVCREVRAPSVEQEDERRRSRERASACQRARPAFEPDQGAVDDPGRARLRAGAG